MQCETATESAERQLTRNGIEFRGRHRVGITPYRRRGVFSSVAAERVPACDNSEKKIRTIAFRNAGPKASGPRLAR